MIIPPRALFSGNSEHWPINGLSERELHNPEGVGVDLRLDSVHVISGEGELLTETRKTADSLPIEPDLDDRYVLRPGNWYVVTTVETMNLPLNLAATIFPRSTLFRSGVALHASVVPPGYKGSLTFALNVVGSSKFVIERRARFCHLVLLDVGDGATPYRGQWQGGRVSQPISEDQK